MKREALDFHKFVLVDFKNKKRLHVLEQILGKGGEEISSENQGFKGSEGVHTPFDKGFQPVVFQVQHSEKRSPRKSIGRQRNDLIIVTKNRKSNRVHNIFLNNQNVGILILIM